MRPVHNNSERREADRGSVIVELALMLPFLTVVFVGIINLGLVIKEHQVVQNAAREGARFSALPQNRMDLSANPAAVETEIKNRVIAYAALENVTINAGDITVSQTHVITVGTTVNLASQVTVSYTTSLLIPGAPYIPFSAITLSGRSVFRNLY